MTIFDIPRSLCIGDARPEDYNLLFTTIVANESVSWPGVWYSITEEGERLVVTEADKRVSFTRDIGATRTSIQTPSHEYYETDSSMFLDGTVYLALEDGTYDVVAENATVNISQSEMDRMTPPWTKFNSGRHSSVLDMSLPGVA